MFRMMPSTMICYEIAITDVRPIVMAGHVRHVPATHRDRLSLRVAEACLAMTVGQHAAGIQSHPIVVPAPGLSDCAIFVTMGILNCSKSASWFR